MSPVVLHTVEAPLNGVAFHAGSGRFGMAGGDGALYVLAQGRPVVRVEVTATGSLLCVAATADGWVCGDDEGALWAVSAFGEVRQLARWAGQFLEHIVFWPAKQKVAVGVGKTVRVVSLDGKEEASLGPLPSTVAGLALHPKAARLAVAAYGGVRIFALDNPALPPRALDWKGAHGAVTYSPDGKWLVSAMQEQTLKIWRLGDGLDLQMRGYPGKISQMSWGHDGMTLATDGGSGVPLWSFGGTNGPAGTAARVMADSGSEDVLVRAVAMHPKGPFLAAGYADGMVLLVNTATEKSLLLHAFGDGEAKAPCGLLAWSADGMALAVGFAGGCAVVDFAQFAG